METAQNSNEAMSEVKIEPTNIPVSFNGVSIDDFIASRDKICKFLEGMGDVMKKGLENNVTDEEKHDLLFSMFFVQLEMGLIRGVLDKNQEVIRTKLEIHKEKKKE